MAQPTYLYPQYHRGLGISARPIRAHSQHSTEGKQSVPDGVYDSFAIPRGVSPILEIDNQELTVGLPLQAADTVGAGRSSYLERRAVATAKVAPPNGRRVIFKQTMVTRMRR